MTEKINTDWLLGAVVFTEFGQKIGTIFDINDGNVLSVISNVQGLKDALEEKQSRILKASVHFNEG